MLRNILMSQIHSEHILEKNIVQNRTVTDA